MKHIKLLGRILGNRSSLFFSVHFTYNLLNKTVISIQFLCLPLPVWGLRPAIQFDSTDHRIQIKEKAKDKNLGTKSENALVHLIFTVWFQRSDREQLNNRIILYLLKSAEQIYSQSLSQNENSKIEKKRQKRHQKYYVSSIESNCSSLSLAVDFQFDHPVPQANGVSR